MKRSLLFIFSFLLFTSSFSQSKISNEQEGLSLNFLYNSAQRAFVQEVDGVDYLFIWYFENIMKVNLDDTNQPVTFIEHQSECSTWSNFTEDGIVSASNDDIYEIDLTTGEEIFHLNIDQSNVGRASKVGDHYYISGFQFDALYQTDLDELFILPHSRHYQIFGDQLLAVENEVAYKEFGALFHIDTADGSIVTDYSNSNIRRTTLFKKVKDVDKIFFTTVDRKLYSLALSDYAITLHCTDFSYYQSDILYKDNNLYIADDDQDEIFRYDYSSCQKMETIAAFQSFNLDDFMEDVHKLENGTAYALESENNLYLFDESQGMSESVSISEGRFNGVNIIDNQFFTVGFKNDSLFFNVFTSSGDVEHSDNVPGFEIFTTAIPEGLMSILVHEGELFKATFKSDYSLSIEKLVEPGLEQGPYETSDWYYRSGYFYSMIGNYFHYKNQSGWIQKIEDIEWNGMPWVNSENNLVGLTATGTGNNLIVYDLENESIISTHGLNNSEEIRSVLEVNNEYYIVSTDNIYSLDITNGTMIELLQDDFIPYLTSGSRSIGRLYTPGDGAFNLASFDGTQFVILGQFIGEQLWVRPIHQQKGLYMLYGVGALTSFNEQTDELIIIPQMGAYFLTNEVRYKGENCFIGFNGVYYYSQDTLVQKAILIEEEDDLDLTYGFVANNTIFASISPFDKLTGVPFAQTTDDEVIELESLLGNVSISDAVFVDDSYYLLSFDEFDVFLHALSADLTQAEELASFPRSQCHFHDSFYFLGPDYEGDINFRIADKDRGTVFYQYEFEEEDISLLFDPSDEIGDDIGEMKFYDDQGFYFTAKDEGYNYQMWFIANEQDPNSVDETISSPTESLVYPNPFGNAISFKKAVKNVCVYDMMGKVVFHKDASVGITFLDGLDELAQGLYLIVYEDEGISKTERVFKM